MNMETKTIYVAFDGKEFIDEDECLFYEKETRYPALAKEHFYNYYGREISFQEFFENPDSVYIVTLYSNEAVREFNELMTEYVFPTDISTTGLYLYQEGYDKFWHLIEDFPLFAANTYSVYHLAKKIQGEHTK